MKQINLLPPEYAYARYFRKRVATWGAFVAAAAAMVGSLGLNLNTQLNAAETEKRRLEDKVQVFKNVAAELQAIANEKTAIASQFAEIHQTQRKQVNTAILHDLALACNDRVFLVEVLMNSFAPALQPAKPQPAHIEKPKPAITLRGYALTNVDLTQLVSELSQSDALKQVNLKYGRQETVMQLKLIAFEIECLPNTER
ncbi:MAG TPA: PilN domain-containing protein [Planctomycetota bacterium]|nr:PilN domain-containing protein [Planctomycetota bacterium]